MVVSIVKGKGRDISSVSQRVERVGEGRIVRSEILHFTSLFYLYLLILYF